VKHMHLGALVVAGLLVAAARPATATTFGPYADYKGTLPPSVTYTLIDTDTSWTNPFTGTVHMDHIKVTIGSALAAPLPVGGAAYGTFSTTDFTGTDIMTTIYGVDLNPGGSSLAMTGFTQPELADLAFSDESFTGNSGTVYDGSGGLVSLADLPGVLPGFDLSPFQGDPSSQVFVYRTVAPESDFVPEPPSLSLLGIPALWLGVLRRRRARR